MKVLTGLLCYFFVTVASATIVDFDNLPDGGTLGLNTILTDQYSSLGVTFSATENGRTVDAAVINSYSPYSGNYWANTTSGSFGPRHDVLSITFDNAVEDVSWLTHSYGRSPILFNAYDKAANLLESFDTYGRWVETSFSSSGIYRIDAVQPLDHWGWGMDNLSFVTIPEPQTILFLCVGLAGMFYLRRKI